MFLRDRPADAALLALDVLPAREATGRCPACGRLLRLARLEELEALGFGQADGGGRESGGDQEEEHGAGRIHPRPPRGELLEPPAPAGPGPVLELPGAPAAATYSHGE